MSKEEIIKDLRRFRRILLNFKKYYNTKELEELLELTNKLIKTREVKDDDVDKILKLSDKYFTRLKYRKLFYI